MAYQPPGAPVTFALTLTVEPDGSIAASGSVGIVTESGTYSAEASIENQIAPAPDETVVIIRHSVSGKVVDTIYSIKTGEQIVITINGRTVLDVQNRKIIVNAADGRITSLVVRNGPLPAIFGSARLSLPGMSVGVPRGWQVDTSGLVASVDPEQCQSFWGSGANCSAGGFSISKITKARSGTTPQQYVQETVKQRSALSYVSNLTVMSQRSFTINGCQAYVAKWHVVYASPPNAFEEYAVVSTRSGLEDIFLGFDDTSNRPPAVVDGRDLVIDPVQLGPDHEQYGGLDESLPRTCPTCAATQRRMSIRYGQTAYYRVPEICAI